MARRAYVKVVVEVSAEGNVRPMEVEWEDGRRFEVDRLLDVRRAAATKAGGQGMPFPLPFLGPAPFLFDDAARWFLDPRP